MPVEEPQNVDNLSDINRILTIAGWGSKENSREISDVLHKGRIRHVSHDSCKATFEKKIKKYPNLRRIAIHDTMVCAGGFNATDTSLGDRGTALSGVAYLHSQPKMFQHGIASFGFSGIENEFFPGIYTRVSKYIKWILDNID